jgi:hypothetical protein
MWRGQHFQQIDENDSSAESASNNWCAWTLNPHAGSQPLCRAGVCIENQPLMAVSGPISGMF